MCGTGIVKNVTEYATTVGETVRNRVQDFDPVRTPPPSLCPPSPSPLSLPQPVTFMTQFQKEQDKFAREQRRLSDAAVPPWVGYNEEEQMKAQILELSSVRPSHTLHHVTFDL